MRFKMTLDVSHFTNNLREITKQMSKIIDEAKTIVAIQMLTYMNIGSPNTNAKPPIRWGVLRGSSTAFVGNRLVGTFSPTADKITSYSGSKDEITIVFNTSYAAKMHEWDGGWGKFTLNDTGAGAKWVEKHINADGPLLLSLFAEEVKKRSR